MIRRWSSQIRLRDWAHFLALPLAGVDPRTSAAVYVPAVGRGVAIAFSILAFGYLLNSIADRNMDVGGAKNSLPRSGLGPHRAAVVGFAAIAVALSALGPWPVVVATLACVASGWIYSSGPRFKAVPVLGSALNVVNFAPLLFVGLATPTLPPTLGLLLAAFSPLLLQNQLLHEAADAEEDRDGNIETTFVRLGSHLTAALAVACGLGATAAVATLGPVPYRAALAVVFAVPFAVVYPVALHRLGHGGAVMARTRVAHRWTSAAAGALLYFAVLAPAL